MLNANHPIQVTWGWSGRHALEGAHSAALTDPPVLVLDEPTAHLSTRKPQRLSWRDVLTAAGERSVLLIIHRPGASGSWTRGWCSVIAPSGDQIEIALADQQVVVVEVGGGLERIPRVAASSSTDTGATR